MGYISRTSNTRRFGGVHLCIEIEKDLFVVLKFIAAVLQQCAYDFLPFIVSSKYYLRMILLPNFT